MMMALITIRYMVTTDHWRWLMWLGASPVVLGLFVWLAVPESVRGTISSLLGVHWRCRWDGANVTFCLVSWRWLRRRSCLVQRTRHPLVFVLDWVPGIS